MVQLAKWNGRIDFDGRYTLWREKKFKPPSPNREHRSISVGWLCLLSLYELPPILASQTQLELFRSSQSPTLSSRTFLIRYLCLPRRVGTDRPRGSGFIDGSNSRIRSQRGLRGITPYGKRMVRNAASILERAARKQNLSLLTCTFPSLSREQWDSVIENWSKTLNRFYEELCRELARHNLPKNYVGVVEVQENRMNRTGEPSLHIHVVFRGRKEGEKWAVTKSRFQQLWSNAWSKTLPSTLNWNASTRVERVVKSVARYLAKYLSKGSQSAARVLSRNTNLYVPAWYACSKTLKKLVKSNTSGSYAIGQYLSEAVRDNKEMFRWMSSISVDLQNGEQFVACYVGYFREWNPPLRLEIYEKDNWKTVTL